MRNSILALAVLATASLLGAQQQAPAQPAQPAPAESTSPVAPQIRPKSPEELKALQAIFQAQTADARIQAAEDFIAKFPDSGFKPLALMLEAQTYQQTNNYDKMVVYAERTLEVDPKNYMAMLMLAEGIAQHTREFDLDREEKLAKVDKYAHQALDILKTAPRPRPDVTDTQWAQAKAEFAAEAHQALGMAAMVRKNYEVAINEYNTAVQTATPPDPATMVRLADAYSKARKFDDAITTANKVMALPECSPGMQPADANCTSTQIKQIAQSVRAGAMQAKNGGKPATPPPAAGATAPGRPATPAPPPAQPPKKP